jgi:CRP/FNR family transcriptional regulator, cyclic AMP receptor protein
VAERDTGRGTSPSLQITEFTDADIVALSRTPLLHELSEDDTAAVRPHTHVVLLRRGEHLYEEGTVDDKLYVIIEGKVKLTRTSPDGREVLVRVQGPGEMFGELAMFDPTYRTSTAAAVTDARLAVIAHADLRDVLVRRPTVAMILLKELAQRLRVITETTTNLIFTDVPGRVAKNLLDLAERFGNQESDGLHVHHDLTQEELAQLVGASRETVNKALADFAARGWLQISARSVLILDQERLRKRAR